MNYELNKEKYLNVLNEKGLSEAISLLHHDLKRLEHECFEGKKGYQPEVFETMKKYRDFSRELWDLRPAPTEVHFDNIEPIEDPFKS